MQALRNVRAIFGRELSAKNGDVFRVRRVIKIAVTKLSAIYRAISVENGARISYKFLCELRDSSLLSALLSITPQSKISKGSRFVGNCRPVFFYSVQSS